MAKRLSEFQKNEIISRFKNGVSIDFLASEFNCTKLTITRNLKKSLGNKEYEKLNLEFNSSRNSRLIIEEKQNKKANSEIGKTKKNIQEVNENINHFDESNLSNMPSFLEIAPLEYEIDNAKRKDLTSIHIDQIDFPKIVFMIVDKKIELEAKFLKDYTEWQFLPEEDLNRKAIRIYNDLKDAKRDCKREQKVLKVPNPNVFKIASSMILSKGISRIVCDNQLIAL